MKKTTKIVSIFITTLFMLSSSIVFAQHQTQQQFLDEPDVVFFDEVDQSQTIMTENAVLPVGQIPIPDNPTNFQLAQSFIPTKEVLTRVELYIGKNSTATYPYVLAIRADLTGSDLVLTSVEPEDVVTEDFGWVEFNFDDVATTIGQTYYIVSYTENVTDNFYAWGANNESDSYVFGCAWMSIDDGDTWGNNSASSQQGNVQTWFNPTGHGSPNKDNVTWDMCFKTYGRGNQAPNTPDITGKINGKAGVAYDYTFTTTDPDGDEVYYWVDWGDGCPVVEWNGPFASGDPFILSHTYENKGDYVISCKAKDVFDEESEWGTLDISMPYAVGKTDSVLGWTFIRGLVGNLKKIGNDLYFRTIRLHYLEFTGMEISMGVLRLKRCRVNDLGYDRQLVIGPLGSLVWIVGFCHGGITEL